MATNTPNYDLVKQDTEEFYDVRIVNANLDKIDTAIKEAKDAADNVDLTEIEQDIADVDARVTQHLDKNNAHTIAQITGLQNSLNQKGTWVGDLENAIPDLNNAPDGVFPFSENSLNRPVNAAIFGSVQTFTGRNENFRVQIAYDDNVVGTYYRKKVLGTWQPWIRIDVNRDELIIKNNYPSMTNIQTEGKANKLVKTVTTEFNQPGYERLIMYVPISEFFGTIEINASSIFFNDDASGGCKLIYHVGLAPSTGFLSVRRDVISVGDSFANAYTFSGFFNDASNYYIILQKRNTVVSNPVQLELTFRATNQNTLNFVDQNFAYYKDISPSAPSDGQLLGYGQEIESLKQNYSDAFDQFAAAITVKGVPTAAGSNKNTILNNINAIPSGGGASGTVVKNLADGIEVRGLNFRPRSVFVRDTSDAYRGSYAANTLLRNDNSRTFDVAIYDDGFRAVGTLLSQTLSIYYECYG